MAEKNVQRTKFEAAEMICDPLNQQVRSDIHCCKLHPFIEIFDRYVATDCYWNFHFIQISKQRYLKD